MDFWRVAMLCLLVVALYGWTLDFPLVFDDVVYLQRNPLMTNLMAFGPVNDLKAFVNAPQKMGLDPDLAVNIVLRPVAYISFKLNHWWDGFNPRSYRAVNIVIHAGNALALGALLRLLLPKVAGPNPFSSWSTRAIAMLTALLFAAHPLATESVTYVVQRFTALGTLFYLSSLLAWFTAVLRGSQKSRLLMKCLACALAVTGMLTKECVFTLPLVVVLIDWLLLGNAVRVSLLRTWPLLCTLPIIPSLVMCLAWAKGGGKWSLTNAIHITNPLDAPMDYGDWVVTQITVVADYLAKLLVPVSLSIDPDWPDSHSILEPFVVTSLGWLATIVLGACLAFWCSGRSPLGRVVLVFTGWFFLTIYISSGLVPLPDNMAEHRTYLPSIGVLVVLSTVLALALETYTNQKSLCSSWTLVCAGLVITFSVLTALRNQVWGSRLTLWQANVAASPKSFRAWSNLGAAQTDLGNNEEAIIAFRNAIAIEPRYYNAHRNLLLCFNKLGQYQSVLDHLLLMEAQSPGSTHSNDVHADTAIALFGLGQRQEALKILHDLTSKQPNFRTAHVILAQMYTKSGMSDLANFHWLCAHRLSPLRGIELELALEVSPNTWATTQN